MARLIAKLKLTDFPEVLSELRHITAQAIREEADGMPETHEGRLAAQALRRAADRVETGVNPNGTVEK